MEKAYVEFGYGGDLSITTNGELLATLGFTEEQLNTDRVEGNEDVPAIFNKFVEAGGDDSHSGYSWSCVRNVAAVLVRNGWKSVDEIPADSPLRERVKIATV